MNSVSVLGMRTDVLTYASAADFVVSKASSEDPAGYVCVANVHMTMESFDSSEFQGVVNGADLVTPDGMPLVWMQKLLGWSSATRVYGPTLVLEVCRVAASAGIPIGLYGGTPSSLESFVAFLGGEFPALSVACAISPPFRPLTDSEDREYVEQLAASGARIVFVGIGCPKQERWMASHSASLPAVLLGVGAAFDFHSGRVRQSPAVLQRLGLEWLFRLVMEPRRLWRRYAVHNPRFVMLAAAQLVGSWLGRSGRRRVPARLPRAADRAAVSRARVRSVADEQVADKKVAP